VLKYSASDNRYKVDNCSRVPTDIRLVGLRAPRDHNAFCAKLRGELDGLVSSLSQFLESPGDCRHKRLSEVACLGRVGLLHLIEQQSPGLIFRLGFSFLTLRQLKRLGRVAQPLAGYRAANLFESAMRPLDVALDAFNIRFHAGRGIPGGADLVFSNDPIRDGQGRVTLLLLLEPGLGRREILGIAQFS
jgi:hypothetical protein